MQPDAGAYGDGLAGYFRADASSHLITRAVRKSKLAVTRASGVTRPDTA